MKAYLKPFTPKVVTCPNSTLANVVSEAVNEYKDKMQWCEDHPSISDDQYVKEMYQLSYELHTQIAAYIKQAGE